MTVSFVLVDNSKLDVVLQGVWVVIVRKIRSKMSSFSSFFLFEFASLENSVNFKKVIKINQTANQDCVQ